MIGYRAFGVEGTAKHECMERIGISKRLRHRGERREARGERGHLAQRSLRHHQLLRHGFQPVGPLLAARFLEAAVAMEGNWAATGRIRPIATLAMLDVEL